ncbi:MAG TPA: Zn-ribbon domain-containing OB-fold protein [Candidatus Binataceae bacterium]
MALIGKPIPTITPGMAEFFAGAKRGQLMAEKCEGCGLMRFPAMEICWKCNSTRARWVPVSGRGEVFSFNIMHQVYHPAFAGEVPYAVVVVQLEEGPRMLSNLIGIKPHDIKCGMPVEVVFEKLSDEVTIPKFKVRASA